MAEFFDRISTWLDPRFVGEIAAAWSGRLLAAFARIKRAIDKYGLAIPAEQRALPAATLASSK